MGTGVRLWTDDEIAALRGVGVDVWKVVTTVAASCQPGVSGRDLDRLARQELTTRRLTPVFPSITRHDGRKHAGVICVSVDDDPPDAEPTATPIGEGSIVTIDLAASRNGDVCDLSTAVGVGPIPVERAAVLEAAREATAEVIRACRPGVLWRSVLERLASWAGSAGVEMVPGFAGHGVGRELHEPPAMPYVAGSSFQDFALVPGMVFTVEPLVRIGSCSASEERMVVVTNGGVEMVAGSLPADVG